jgi:hypothetical protein
VEPIILSHLFDIEVEAGRQRKKQRDVRVLCWVAVAITASRITKAPYGRTAYRDSERPEPEGEYGEIAMEKCTTDLL